MGAHKKEFLGIVLKLYNAADRREAAAGAAAHTGPGVARHESRSLSGPGGHSQDPSVDNKSQALRLRRVL